MINEKAGLAVIADSAFVFQQVTSDNLSVVDLFTLLLEEYLLAINDV